MGGNKNKGSGGGSKKPPPSDEEKIKALSALGLGVAALLGILALDNMKNGNEISWQDFQRQLLEAGLVDRIIVTNKNVAKIVLRLPVTDKVYTLHTAHCTLYTAHGIPL